MVRLGGKAGVEKETKLGGGSLNRSRFSLFTCEAVPFFFLPKCLLLFRSTPVQPGSMFCLYAQDSFSAHKRLRQSVVCSESRARPSGFHCCGAPLICGAAKQKRKITIRWGIISALLPKKTTGPTSLNRNRSHTRLPFRRCVCVRVRFLKQLRDTGKGGVASLDLYCSSWNDYFRLLWRSLSASEFYRKM